MSYIICQLSKLCYCVQSFFSFAFMRFPRVFKDSTWCLTKISYVKKHKQNTNPVRSNHVGTDLDQRRTYLGKSLKLVWELSQVLSMISDDYWKWLNFFFWLLKSKMYLIQNYIWNLIFTTRSSSSTYIYSINLSLKIPPKKVLLGILKQSLERNWREHSSLDTDMKRHWNSSDVVVCWNLLLYVCEWSSGNDRNGVTAVMSDSSL